MVLLLAGYAVILILLICGIAAFKGNLRKICTSLVMCLVVIPTVLICLVYVFKSEIQQGKFLPNLAPILILLSPPQDLFNPLVTENIDPNRKDYKFQFRHKYVGNHHVELAFSKNAPESKASDNLELHYVVKNGNKVLFQQNSKVTSQYWGQNQNGLIFITYAIPQALPVNVTVDATVTVSGDIKAFLKDHGPTQVVVRKGSDL